MLLEEKHIYQHVTIDAKTLIANWADRCNSRGTSRRGEHPVFSVYSSHSLLGKTNRGRRSGKRDVRGSGLGRDACAIGRCFRCWSRRWIWKSRLRGRLGRGRRQRRCRWICRCTAARTRSTGCGRGSGGTSQCCEQRKPSAERSACQWGTGNGRLASGEHTPFCRLASWGRRRDRCSRRAAGSDCRAQFDCPSDRRPWRKFRVELKEAA